MKGNKTALASPPSRAGKGRPRSGMSQSFLSAGGADGAVLASPFSESSWERRRKGSRKRRSPHCGPVSPASHAAGSGGSGPLHGLGGHAERIFQKPVNRAAETPPATATRMGLSRPRPPGFIEVQKSRGDTEDAGFSLCGRH